MNMRTLIKFFFHIQFGCEILIMTMTKIRNGTNKSKAVRISNGESWKLINNLQYTSGGLV